MEIFFEVLFEIYLNLGEILIPDRKFKKWQRTLLQVLCVLVCCVIFACLAVGISFLFEGKPNFRVPGIVLVSVGAVLFAVQVGLAVVVIVHDYRQEKKKKSVQKQD